MTTYPTVNLWDCDSSPLTIINSGDFRHEAMLTQFKLRSSSLVCPTGDGGEIKRRQRLLDFMMSRARGRMGLRRMLRASQLPIRQDVPVSKQGFLDHFTKDGTSSFVATLKEELTALEAAGESLPTELGDLCSSIRGNLVRIEQAERDFYSGIAPELKQDINLLGRVHFEYRHGAVELEELEGCGYRRFAHHPFEDRKWDIPWWMDSAICRWTGIRGVWSVLCEMQHIYWDQYDYGPQIIEEAPDELVGVLRDFVKNLFTKSRPRDVVEASFNIELFFRYEDGVLQVGVTRLWRTEDPKARKSRREEYRKQSEHYIPSDFPGYGARHIRRLGRLRRRLIKYGLDNAQVFRSRYKLSEYFGRCFGDLDFVEVELSESFLSKYSSREILAICKERPDLNELFEEITAFRTWAAGHMRTVQEIAFLAENYLTLQKEWGLKATFPQVLDDSAHTVSFTGLQPIHLIGRGENALTPKDLVDIDGIPELNGRMVALTGLNAAGKTVVLQELVEQLYLAHCGLPVFGTSFAFNPKEALALVFIERGDGSTAELLGKKIAQVLAAAEEYSSHRILVVLDELGTGTEASVGYELGKAALAKLRKAGCSVLFSTQIPTLADFAHHELGAMPFKMDGDHRIQTGVGQADLSDLMQRTGLDVHFSDQVH